MDFLHFPFLVYVLLYLSYYIYLKHGLAPAGGQTICSIKKNRRRS